MVSALSAARRRGLVFAVAATLAAAACGEPPPPPAPAAPPVKTAEERAHFYQECWNHFNNQAWDQFGMCYSETAVSESADGTPASLSGRADIIARGKLEAGGFPDRRGEVRLLLINGDRLASIALYTGTNTGPLPPGPDGKSMPATKKPIGLLMAHTAELDPTGSRVVRDAAYFEEATLAAQLGLSKSKQRPAEKPSGASPVTVIARNDETERTNQAAARSLLEALNKHDLDAYGKLLPDDYKLIEVAQPRDLDKKGALASTKEMLGGFPDVAITPTTMWAAGDYVVTAGTFAGTNTGNLPTSMGLQKTGKKVSLRFLNIQRFDKGQLKEDWLFYNASAFATQLAAK
jgi:predicted ester cyclase